jgi:hypothetical protein
MGLKYRSELVEEEGSGMIRERVSRLETTTSSMKTYHEVFFESDNHDVVAGPTLLDEQILPVRIKVVSAVIVAGHLL